MSQKSQSPNDRGKLVGLGGRWRRRLPSAPGCGQAEGPVSFRFQSTWPSKDIFHEFAQDYAKKVNDMTGGALKIEVSPAGAVTVPAFGLLEAVSKGARWRPRGARLSLWQAERPGFVGLGVVFAM